MKVVLPEPARCQQVLQDLIAVARLTGHADAYYCDRLGSHDELRVCFRVRHREVGRVEMETTSNSRLWIFWKEWCSWRICFPAATDWFTLLHKTTLTPLSQDAFEVRAEDHNPETSKLFCSIMSHSILCGRFRATAWHQADCPWSAHQAVNLLGSDHDCFPLSPQSQDTNSHLGLAWESGFNWGKPSDSKFLVLCFAHNADRRSLFLWRAFSTTANVPVSDDSALCLLHRQRRMLWFALRLCKTIVDRSSPTNHL